MPAILVTCEAESGRIVVQNKPGQKVLETPSIEKAGNGGMCLSSQLLGKHK
jgi:hypothetical protein